MFISTFMSSEFNMQQDIWCCSPPVHTVLVLKTEILDQLQSGPLSIWITLGMLLELTFWFYFLFKRNLACFTRLLHGMSLSAKQR